MTATLAALTLGIYFPGGWEWIVILVVALLLFGKRLPEVGKSLGKGIVEFKKGLKGMKEEMDDIDREVDEAVAREDKPKALDDKPVGERSDPAIGEKAKDKTEA